MSQQGRFPLTHFFVSGPPARRRPMRRLLQFLGKYEMINETGIEK